MVKVKKFPQGIPEFCRTQTWNLYMSEKGVRMI